MIEVWTLVMILTGGTGTMVVPNLPTEAACQALAQRVRVAWSNHRGLVPGATAPSWGHCEKTVLPPAALG